MYTFCKEYQTEEYDEKIVKEIQEILYECNNIYLKSKGYVAKCDEWGTWLSVSEVDKKETPSDIFSNESIWVFLLIDNMNHQRKSSFCRSLLLSVWDSVWSG